MWCFMSRRVGLSAFRRAGELVPTGGSAASNGTNHGCTGLYCSLESRPRGEVRRGVSGTPIARKSFNISNNDEFMEKVMNSSVPVIVNFHAEWCDPCHILTPKLKELVGESDNINLAIVDVEANPDLVHTFEVKAVPAVLAIRNGLVIDKFIGLVDANMIENLVEKLLPKTKPQQAVE